METATIWLNIGLESAAVGSCSLQTSCATIYCSHQRLSKQLNPRFFSKELGGRQLTTALFHRPTVASMRSYRAVKDQKIFFTGYNEETSFKVLATKNGRIKVPGVQYQPRTRAEAQ